MCECPFSGTLTSTAYFHFCVSCVKFLSKATAAFFPFQSLCLFLTSGSPFKKILVRTNEMLFSKVLSRVPDISIVLLVAYIRLLHCYYNSILLHLVSCLRAYSYCLFSLSSPRELMFFLLPFPRVGSPFPR